MFAHNFKHEFGHDFGGFRPMGGGRMGRGMMEPLILHALLTKPMHGYEIISTLEEQSHGFWRPSAGSIYPTLQLLEEKGHVTASEQDGKKVYTLTPEGETEAHQADDFESHWNENRKFHQARSFQNMREMRELMGLVIRDMRTIMRKGNDEQYKKMHDLLENLHRELYTTTKGEQQ